MSPPEQRNYRSLCFFIALLPWTLLTISATRYHRNLFVQTCRLAAQELNETNCWVCALMPSHQGSEFPLQAVPANASELLVERPGRATGQLEKETLEVNYEAAFPVCFQWLARTGAPDLGTTTRCQTTITRSPDDPSTINGLLPPELSATWNISVSSSPSPRNFPLLNAACRVWDRPFAACLSITPWEVQEEFYWVCGHRAYKQLPKVWTGSCALGHVVPAIRVTKERPAGRIRNTRELQQSRDIVNTYQPLTDWDLYLSSLVPQIGVVRVGWATYRLQAIIELLTNETSETFELLATEQRELRKLALQNRMALDMILASHGGVCALIGSECCVFVPDASEEIFDHAKHIAGLGALAKDDSHEWLKGWKEWFGSWWGKITIYLISFILCLVVLVVCSKLCYLLCLRLCLKKTPMTIMINMYPDHIQPAYEEENAEIINMYNINVD